MEKGTYRNVTASGSALRFSRQRLYHLFKYAPLEKVRRRPCAPVVLLLGLVLLSFAPALTVRAAFPLSATLDPAAANPVTWVGTAMGPAAATSTATSCREGIDCDTFILTFAGTAADWAGKTARLKINWQLMTTDYDLYLLRETSDGLFVLAQSANHPTNSHATSEVIDFDPYWYGTGRYLVRVLYVAATFADQYAGSAGVTASAGGSVCKLPGLSVLADKTGDSLDANTGHDIENVSIAEPYTVGANKLVFTMKVADLSTLPSDTIWRVSFRVPNLAGPRYFVEMRTDSAGSAGYKYGTEDGTVSGDADAGAYDPQRGAIKIVVSSGKIGNPTPGQYPPQRLEQIYAQVIAGPVIADSAPDRDLELSQAGYTPAGNASCTGGRIAFVSDRGGSYDVYAANVDGTNVTRLTNDAAQEDTPFWSPDGTKLAYQSNRDGRNNIFVMNADGSNQINLTPGTGDDHYPVWSPDGTRIVFESYRDGPQPEIYSIRPDGSGLTRLTNNTADDYFPSWSPDGRKIIFSSNRTFSIEVFVMNADGSNQTRLTTGAGVSMMPAWSPDGTKVAFVSDRDAPFQSGHFEVYVMNADGSSPVRLTFNAGDEYFPRWSPDGLNLVCASWRDGNSELYVMDASGSPQVNFTNNPAADITPSWQP